MCLIVFRPTKRDTNYHPQSCHVFNTMGVSFLPLTYTVREKTKENSPTRPQSKTSSVTRRWGSVNIIVRR